MGHTIMDSLGLTIVAMSLVFLILSGIMILMQITAKIVNKPDSQSNTTSQKATHSNQTRNNQSNVELERVAILTALAVASEDESGKHYKIEKIERVK